MCNCIETWKHFNKNGYNYFLSSKGILYRETRNGFMIMKKHKINSGYFYLKIMGKKYLIHRLLYEYFIDNNIKGFEIEHKDADKINNCICNLNKTDRKGNMNNPITRKRISQSMKGNKNFLGKKHTEETKRKISDTQKRRLKKIIMV